MTLRPQINALTSKLYLRMFCGSLYRILWSPLNTFLHCPPKLTVLITPALSSPVRMSYLQTFQTASVGWPQTGGLNQPESWCFHSLLLLTLFQSGQSWEEVYPGHMRAGCRLGCSLFRPDHPHSPGLHYRPETG